MVQRFCLPALSGQRRALLAFSLVALTILPVAARAQDVIVLPPPTTTATATTTAAPANISAVPVADPVSAPVEAAPSAVTTSVPTVQTDATTSVSAPAPITASPRLDLVSLQCATDADCVITEDGCTTLAAVNRAYVAHWKAVMSHYPECRPAYDLAKVQLTTQATCRVGWCALLPRNRP